MTLAEADSQAAFYLAQSGLERARESYKSGFSAGKVSWNDVLLGKNAAYPEDSSPYCWASPPSDSVCLCPPGLNHGCAMPAFQTVLRNPSVIQVNGHGVVWPDIPIAGMFASGSQDSVWYSVRAFNDTAGEDWNNRDGNGIMIVRAVGVVRGEVKVVESQLLAAGIGLINCLGEPGDPCPSVTKGSPKIEPTIGHDPRSAQELPYLDSPLSSPANYYRTVKTLDNDKGLQELVARPMPATDVFLVTHPTQLDDVKLEDNSLYYSTHNITVGRDTDGFNDAAGHVVIISLGTLKLDEGVVLTNAVLAGGNEVRINLKAGDLVRAARAHPAIISENRVTNSDNGKIEGNIYASQSVDLSGVSVKGVIISPTVNIQGSGTITDALCDYCYDAMPGFVYPEEFLTSTIRQSTWRELK
jgi:hypothetical protein